MPRILHISEARVLETLTVAESIRLAKEAYVKLARGLAVSPERTWFTTRKGLSVYCMPAHIVGRKTVAVKIARLNPRNPTVNLPSVAATVYVYDSSSGRELAQIEAETLTALRTAASTAVATDFLARKRARTLGVLGTGRQAEAHIPAISAVRRLAEVVVFSRNRKRREAFARKASRKYKIHVMASESPERVVESSEILVLATNSKTPLFNGKLVRPGTHVNAVGAALPDAREIDTALVKRSFVVVDSLAQAKSSYGEIVIPLNEKAIKEKDVHELGDLLVHGENIRRNSERITVFKAGGLAVLDAISADFLVSRLAVS